MKDILKLTTLLLLLVPMSIGVVCGVFSTAFLMGWHHARDKLEKYVDELRE